MALAHATPPDAASALCDTSAALPVRASRSSRSAEDVPSACACACGGGGGGGGGGDGSESRG